MKLSTNYPHSYPQNFPRVNLLIFSDFGDKIADLSTFPHALLLLLYLNTVTISRG